MQPDHQSFYCGHTGRWLKTKMGNTCSWMLASPPQEDHPASIRDLETGLLHQPEGSSQEVFMDNFVPSSIFKSAPNNLCGRHSGPRGAAPTCLPQQQKSFAPGADDYDTCFPHKSQHSSSSSVEAMWNWSPFDVWQEAAKAAHDREPAAIDGKSLLSASKNDQGPGHGDFHHQRLAAPIPKSASGKCSQNAPGNGVCQQELQYDACTDNISSASTHGIGIISAIELPTKIEPVAASSLPSTSLPGLNVASHDTIVAATADESAACWNDTISSAPTPTTCASCGEPHERESAPFRFRNADMVVEVDNHEQAKIEEEFLKQTHTADTTDILNPAHTQDDLNMPEQQQTQMVQQRFAPVENPQELVKDENLFVHDQTETSVWAALEEEPCSVMSADDGNVAYLAEATAACGISGATSVWAGGDDPQARASAGGRGGADSDTTKRSRSGKRKSSRGCDGGKGVCDKRCRKSTSPYERNETPTQTPFPRCRSPVKTYAGALQNQGQNNGNQNSTEADTNHEAEKTTARPKDTFSRVNVEHSFEELVQEICTRYKHSGWGILPAHGINVGFGGPPGQVARQEVGARDALAWLRSGQFWNHRKWRNEIAATTQAAAENGGYCLYQKPFVHLKAKREAMLFGTSIHDHKEVGKKMKKPKRTWTGDNPVVEWQELNLVTDCIWKHDESRDGALGVVNAGNRFSPGGGFATGGRHALEEALCVQSTLYSGLVRAHQILDKEFQQPALGHFQVICTPDVQFFRSGPHYMFALEPRTATVFTLAMYNRNRFVNGQPRDVPENYNEYMKGVKKKFWTLFQTVEDSESVQTLVMCDIGCGVYENSPGCVGDCLGHVIASFPFNRIQKILLTGDKKFFNAVCKHAQHG
ncbi:unnamed protein product [Amoebophrya sp. A120]|nr:unnamed protein product [Amoebophrya sp. A120]|eukprot:GSA120T00003370001.1